MVPKRECVRVEDLFVGGGEEDDIAVAEGDDGDAVVAEAFPEVLQRAGDAMGEPPEGVKPPISSSKGSPGRAFAAARASRVAGEVIVP